MTSQHQLAVLVDGIATSLNLGVDLESSSRRSTFRLDDALSVFDPLTSGEAEVEEMQNGAILAGKKGLLKRRFMVCLGGVDSG